MHFVYNIYINYVQNNDKVDLTSGNFPWKMTLENRINYSYYLTYSYYLLVIFRFAINNISDNDDDNNVMVITMVIMIIIIIENNNHNIT